jgi:hypothetical protein
MGGLESGSCVEILRGDEDLERERELDVIFVGGDMGLVDEIGDGAWICIDMARVGGRGAGTRARFMKLEGGGRRDGVELCKKEKDVSKQSVREGG